MLDAAKQLDYRPSLIPRIMLTHKSNLVAIVVGGLYNPFYSAVLEQFTIKFQAAGHQVLLVHVASDHALDDGHPQACQLPRRCHRQRLAILSPNAAQHTGQAEDTGHFLQHRREERVGHAGIHATMSRRAARSPSFRREGARSFGFISGPVESHASAGRLKGFQDSLSELDAGQARIGRGDYRYEGGFAAALDMFVAGTAGPRRCFAPTTCLPSAPSMP